MERDKKLAFAILIITWYSLCSETGTVRKTAQQHYGVGKRERRPGRVIISRFTVIVLDKDDCEA